MSPTPEASVGAHDECSSVEAKRACPGKSERTLCEQALHQQQELLNATLDNMAEGVVLMDDTAAVRLWNRAAARILGLTEPTAPMAQWPTDYGAFLADGTTPWPLDQTPLARALRGEEVSNVEMLIRHPGRPEDIWVCVNARPLTGGADKPIGALAVFRDVTEERRLQAQLLTSDRMASIGLLAAGVAHEINNPLAAIVANLDLAAQEVQLLSQQLGADRVRNLDEEIDEARNCSERVRQIVRDLKVLSRSEAEIRAPLDVRQVLRSAMRTASHELQLRARVVEDYHTVRLVEANEAQLAQVFLNLIVNAAQAIPEGDAANNEVRLVTRMDDAGRIVVEVRDTGSGMTPETVGRLFTPFFSTKPVGIGTGLGLSICRRIVTGIGGDIQVESRPGRGSVFRVVLPATADRMTPVGEGASTPEGAARRARVLVIDDDSFVLASIRRILSCQHDVVMASRARDALDQIATGMQFDVILCDLMMPQMTGMDFYAELQRSAPKQTERVVFMTGGTFTTMAREFLDRVPNQTMEKPFDMAALRAVVTERLGS